MSSEAEPEHQQSAPSKHKIEQVPDFQAFKSRGYLLGRPIAKGAFATVIRAKYYEPRTGDGLQKSLDLACKIIDESKSKDFEFLTKFLPRELQILARIEHPNIIQTHSIMRRGSRVFIFMRLAELGDLLSYIQRHGALAEERSRFWFYQMVDAIQYLHQMDIAHRDLKCENILISKNMNIKLSDFGFARHCKDKIGSSILSSTFCGSAAYAAPEIVGNKPYQPKAADLWSLGVVLFIMLNGTMPFDERNLKKLERCQVGRQYCFRPEVRKAISFDAVRIVYNLLDPNPVDRINIDEVIKARWEVKVVGNKNQ